jgi:hypothetical protein
MVMRICPVVASTLAVWYLMVPPSLPHSSGLDTAAPLSRWIRLGYRQYATEEQCLEDLEANRREMQNLGARLGQTTAEAEQCVCSDDPRLSR